MLCTLLLGVTGIIGLAAEDYDDLIEEHYNYDWEKISLSLLAGEIEEAAKEENLNNFQVSIQNDTISIIYRDLQFPPDSPEITEETKEKIIGLTNVLAQFSGKNLLLEGHTAAVPGDEDDGSLLSGERSTAVAEVMAQTGAFARESIEAAGRGEYFPIADNETPEGRELNRRVEVSIVNKVENNDLHNKSIWWNQLSGKREPGYSVFVLDNDKTDLYSLQDTLEEKGYVDLPVYYTSEGVAVVYDNAQFTNEGAPTIETQNDLTNMVDTFLYFDRNTQLRIGGESDKAILEELGIEQYNLGKYTAFETDMRTGGILIGDYPYTFICSAKGENKGLLAGIDFSLNQSLPLIRYAEFSHVGLGAGSSLLLRIPSQGNNSALSNLRAQIAIEGLYHIPESSSSVESMLEFNWLAGIGYTIEMARKFHIMPLISYGGTIHILNNTQEIDTSTYEALQGGLFYSQTLAVELDLSLSPEKWVNSKNDQLSLFMKPGYRVFFDSNYLGHSLTLKSGIRINY